MPVENVISLTRKLIAFDTINPPGKEKEMALYVGNLLSKNGFKVEYIPFETDRLHVIAEIGINYEIPSIVFTGHFDTVPLGAKQWNENPFGGEVKEGKLFGRGSSDMKGGLAAMIIAAIEATQNKSFKNGVRLIFT